MGGVLKFKGILLHFSKGGGSSKKGVLVPILGGKCLIFDIGQSSVGPIMAIFKQFPQSGICFSILNCDGGRKEKI